MKATRRVVVVSVAVAVATASAVGYPVYVDPVADRPAHADAIVVLGGSEDNRDELGLELAEDGYAPELVYSNPYGSVDRLTEICRDGRSDVTVECFVPEPGTTRGEAREIRDRAGREGWKSVVVVTSTPHLSRARYIIGKCWDGDVTYVPSTTDRYVFEWAWEYVYQTAGYARAVFEDC
ncbi:YdcF family protein [Rhodococcus sp. Eu-32]|uniref:YdcF family protein n=1 Tax=Rhodococcus sp. Eu-32 TaxID=1017319 RepID=UPI000DF3D56E|nr:YdcF family protein [Rhodococcus sp. Eu-32]RRQ29119.1 YdcF family protein [Rhodococcus sp. Eu-32]